MSNNARRTPSHRANRAVAGALLGVSLWVAAASAIAAPECNDANAGYVQPFVDNSDTVLIFVHGLSGDPSATWRHGATPQTAWPCLLKNDRQFAKANLFLYGYPSGLVGEQPSMVQVAERMLEDLDRVMRAHQQVVFVVHSLGGLVTSQMLMKAASVMSGRELHRRTKLVMFYGSPGGGSAAAQLATVVKPAVQVQELADLSLLDAVVTRWNEADISKKGRCFAETRPMGGMFARGLDAVRTWFFGQQPALIVSADSAFALCGKRGRTIADADHSEIVKPTRSQHESYKALSAQFHACVRPPAVAGAVVSLGGSATAETTRQWREKFEQALAAARANQTSSSDLVPWLYQPEVNSFLQTPDADPQAGVPYRRGIVPAGQFLVVLRDSEVLRSPTAVEQVGVAMVKDMHMVAEDVEVRARVDELLQAGRLRNDDIAVVIEDRAVNARWLLWLALPTNAADKALLRGYTRLSMRTGCDHQAD
jgi:pimeloyl-ACP methyl ester carboxylesterase